MQDASSRLACVRVHPSLAREEPWHVCVIELGFRLRVYGFGFRIFGV